MSVSLNELTDGIIFYSLKVSNFERLDFKNDALAGIRANYFNSSLSAQCEECDISIDEKSYRLSCKLVKGRPLSWKVSRKSIPYQAAKKEAGGVYCVLYYSDKGVVCKRRYFDADHIWLRTEYYSRLISNELMCRVYPQVIRGATLLVKETVVKGDIRKTLLFPSSVKPDGEPSALAYTNIGMIWYDESFATEEFKDIMPERQYELSKKEIAENLFKNADASDAIDLGALEYLENPDGIGEKEPESEIELKPESEPESEIELKPESEPESKPESESVEEKVYSAYDRIESILKEAHRVNKNLFGEILEYTGGSVNYEKILAEDEKPEAVPTIAEEHIDEPSVKAGETADSVDKTDKAVEAAEDKAPESEYKPIFDADAEDKRSAVISSSSGKYSYYGSLDDDGFRTGKGRTVSPDGNTVYEGNYKNDRRDGFGVFYYKNGDINYIGEWSQNKRNGAGVGYRTSDGTMHAGKWNGNLPTDCGARFDKDGNFIDLSFYDGGVKSGKSISLDENGRFVLSIWENGEKISERVIE